MAMNPSTKDSDYDWSFRYRYETLRAILNRNGRILQILSDLEADLNNLTFSDFRIHIPVQRLFDETYMMAQELNMLSHGRYAALYQSLDRIRHEVKKIEEQAATQAERPVVVRLDDEDSLDPQLVGGKAAGLSSLHHNFPGQVPGGFILTTKAYDLFLREGKLFEQIRLLLKNIELTSDRDRFRQRTEAIRDAITSVELPASIKEAIQQHASIPSGIDTDQWAVRSSAVSEDGRYSFAGQFESLLNVPSDKLFQAYKEVLAGKYTERAIAYHVNCGFREVDTPMAVLFMPMIDPQAAGVIYTTDPLKSDSNTMEINCVEGLGDIVVKGIGVPDHITVSRQSRPEIMDIKNSKNPGAPLDYLPQDTILSIGAIAWKAMVTFGFDLDIEWAVDKQDLIWLLQGRRVLLASPEKIREERTQKTKPLVAKGISIFPGRAEGPVAFRSESNLEPIPKGAVLVLEQPTPELAPLLSDAAAVVAKEGSPVGHLATLIREFAIPSVFQVGGEIANLRNITVVSIDASRRKIYAGSRWPEMKERVLSRLASAKHHEGSGPLFNLVLSLNLFDPFASNFKPQRCRSVHDVVRFIHEMSVRSMFKFGDEHSGFLNKKTKRLKSKIPLTIYVLALDQTIPAKMKTIEPRFIFSTPFRAFWKGFSDPDLSWPDRWGRAHSGLPKDFQEQVFGGTNGPRRKNDPNYLIFARDYMNFNARYAYHYAMVDSLLGEGDRNNYVQLRFHNGGGSDEKRQRRARFLERVLRESRFGVTRERDLITAWFRNYPYRDTEEALELLGRLLVCSRQLDILMNVDSDVKMFSDHFLAGKYGTFS